VEVEAFVEPRGLGHGVLVGVQRPEAWFVFVGSVGCLVGLVCG
jgi:hypothetical protein